MMVTTKDVYLNDWISDAIGPILWSYCDWLLHVLIIFIPSEFCESQLYKALRDIAVYYKFYKIVDTNVR